MGWVGFIDPIRKEAINAIKNGKVFIVDEIENCFQKNLVYNLLFLFNDEKINKYGAQIIFSTHYVEILDYLCYNKNKKGYEVTPSELEALNRIIKLFGEITDFGALNTLWSVLHVNAPIKITPNVNILTLISSGYLKPKGSTFLKNTIRRKKLSAVAKLKPQHNYVIEYTDGSTEKFTFNTPVSYRELKNIVCFGKKGNPDLLPPLNYEQLLAEKINQVRVDGVDPRIEVLYSYFKTPRLLQSSVMHETGFGKEEIKRLFGIFASKEKGGLTTHELAEIIYADHDDIFLSKLFDPQEKV